MVHVVGREANITEAQWAEMQRQGRIGAATPLEVKGVRPRTERGMNSWERLYAQELESRRMAGEILWWGYEAIKLRLADATFYSPDFAVLGLQLPDPSPVLQFVEIKGFLREDAAIKFKVAAAAFPWARFTMLRKRRAKEGAGWDVVREYN